MLYACRFWTIVNAINHTNKCNSSQQLEKLLKKSLNPLIFLLLLFPSYCQYSYAYKYVIAITPTQHLLTCLVLSLPIRKSFRCPQCSFCLALCGSSLFVRLGLGHMQIGLILEKTFNFNYKDFAAKNISSATNHATEQQFCLGNKKNCILKLTA